MVGDQEAEEAICSEFSLGTSPSRSYNTLSFIGDQKWEALGREDLTMVRLVRMLIGLRGYGIVMASRSPIQTLCAFDMLLELCP